MEHIDEHNWEDKTTITFSTWLMTFADMLSLMLTFFVLIYSMTVTQEDFWDGLSNSFATTFIHSNRIIPTKELGDNDTPITFQEVDADLKYVANILKMHFRKHKDLGDAYFQIDDERLVISLPSKVLFASGSDNLKKAGKKASYIVANILNNINVSVEVYGHTDSTPTKGHHWPTNWELSLDRAISVAHQLKESGYLKPVSARGLSYFQSQNYEKPKNPFDLDGLNMKDQQARRVDIVIKPYVPNG